MKVIYIAGPIRAETPLEMHENIIQAVKATKRIFLLGAVPLCVHPHALYLEGDIPPELYLPVDMELIRRSDAVFLLDGWTYSGGAMEEEKFAVEIGLPTFDDWKLLEIWISESSTKNTG